MTINKKNPKKLKQDLVYSYRKCENCGEFNVESAHYCQNCGYNLNESKSKNTTKKEYRNTLKKYTTQVGLQYIY